MKVKIKPPDCIKCHNYCYVDNRHGCTDTPQRQGKPCYKLLKSLDICRDFLESH